MRYILIYLFLFNYSIEAYDLINVAHVNENIVIDLIFASPDNFTGKVIYENAASYLLKKVALALNKVQQELEKDGLRLKIYDAYRPLSAQKALWDFLPDARYVSPPDKGGRHTRGTAVDVTLVDKNGNELLMPSQVSTFGPESHRDFMNVSKEALHNRKLLEEIMVRHGFIPFQNEWWHFDFHDWQQYPPLDIDFGRLS